jgi:hypothetical protein
MRSRFISVVWGLCVVLMGSSAWGASSGWEPWLRSEPGWPWRFEEFEHAMGGEQPIRPVRFETVVPLSELADRVDLELIVWHQVVIGSGFYRAVVLVPQQPGMRYEDALRFAVSDSLLTWAGEREITRWLSHEEDLREITETRQSHWRNQPSDVFVRPGTGETLQPYVPQIRFDAENGRYVVTSWELRTFHLPFEWSELEQDRGASEGYVIVNSLHPYPTFGSRSGLMILQFMPSTIRYRYLFLVTFVRDVGMLRGLKVARRPFASDDGPRERWMFPDEVLLEAGLKVRERGEALPPEHRKLEVLSLVFEVQR